MILKFKKEYYLPIILISSLVLFYPLMIYISKFKAVGYLNLSLAILLTRLYQIIPMVIIALFFIYFIFAKKNFSLKFTYEKILFLFMPLAFTDFLIGLINKNSLFYNLGDSYSLILVSIVYFVGMSFYSKDLNVEKIFKYILYIYVFFFLADFVLQIFNFIYYKKLIYLSLFNFSFPLVFFLFLENKKIKHYGFISLLLLSAILTLKRGYWVFIFLYSFHFFIEQKEKEIGF